MYQLIYVFIQIVNKSDKLLFAKKDCLLHPKIGQIFAKPHF